MGRRNEGGPKASKIDDKLERMEHNVAFCGAIIKNSTRFFEILLIGLNLILIFV